MITKLDSQRNTSNRIVDLPSFNYKTQAIYRQYRKRFELGHDEWCNITQDNGEECDCGKAEKI